MTSFYNFRAIERPNYNTSVKIRTKTIEAIFDFSSIFRTCYFQQRHSSHSSLFWSSWSLKWFPFAVFFFHARIMRSVQCSGKTGLSLENQNTKVQKKKREWNNEPSLDSFIQCERKFCSLPVNTPQLARYPRLLHAKPSNKVYLGYL